MEKVIIEQFNPVSGYWNELLIVDKDLFDSNMVEKLDKYGGPKRVRTVEEPTVVTPDPDEPTVVEEPKRKRTYKKAKVLVKEDVLQTFDDDDGAIN